jgi:excisionase family DNA binding protein
VPIACPSWRRCRQPRPRPREAADERADRALDHRLLTAEEVAELLRLPVSTIYDLARTGRLLHLRIGRALRFSQRDLEAHLAERCRAQVGVRL